MNKMTSPPVRFRRTAAAVVFLAAAATLTACGEFKTVDRPNCDELAGKTVPAEADNAMDVCNAGNGISKADLSTLDCPTGGKYLVYKNEDLAFVGKTGGTWAAFSGDTSDAKATAEVACK